jgi:transposase
MAQSNTLSVGMEVHQESIAVASGAHDYGAEVISLGTVGTRQCDLDTLIRQLPSKSKARVLVSEAGPGGYWLYRSLPQKGHGCWGIAPSLLPQKPGDRVTTARRDALQLARLRRSRALPPGSGPAVQDAAVRDLSRAREETLHALQTAKFRRNALLLRQDSRYTGRATWGPAPRRWLRAVVCPPPAQHIVCHADVRAVTAHPDRLQRLAQALHEPVPAWRLCPVGDAVQALRGVPVTVAVTTVAALGDLTRFEPPRQRMKDRGRTPAAAARGARRRPGGLAQTGHTQARRALVEGAWA